MCTPAYSSHYTYETASAYDILARDYPFDGDDEEALKAHIVRYAVESLTPYKLPEQVGFLKEMPLTDMGISDKKALRSANQ